MSDDSLLRALARVAREDREAEEAELDGRWDALAAGLLPTAEEEELRALAQGSPEAGAAYEAFRPLGADFRARVVEAARFQVGTKDRPAPAATEPRPAPARPVSAVRRRRQRWWIPAAAALAAASVLLLLWPSRLPPLPTYGLELEGHVSTLRAPGPEAAAGRRVFVPGNRLRLVLTPAVAVEGPVEVRAFVLSSGVLTLLDAPPPAVSEGGAVLVEGEVGADVRLPAGDLHLLVAVGRPGSLPSGEELRSLLAESDGAREDAWTAWNVALVVEEGPEP
jgi:hypothetical protein